MEACHLTVLHPIRPLICMIFYLLLYKSEYILKSFINGLFSLN